MIIKAFCFHCKSENLTQFRDAAHHDLYECQDCGIVSGRVLGAQGDFMVIRTAGGKIKHISAVAIIIRDSKLLLLDRTEYPFGLSFPGGHLQYGETIEATLFRETEEETGLKPRSVMFMDRFPLVNPMCKAGADIEEWAVFLVELPDGEPTLNEEHHGLRWTPIDELTNVDLVEPARETLVRLGYINQ